MDNGITEKQYNDFLAKAIGAAGFAIQEFFTKVLSAEFPDFRWIQTSSQHPAFQHLCFGYKNQVFSVLVAIDTGEGLFVNNKDLDNQLHECKANNMVATMIGVKKDSYKPSFPGCHLVYSDSRDLVRLESFDFNKEMRMSEWEIRNLGIHHVVDALQKKGASIGGVCDVLAIDPQIWFELDGKQCYAFVRAYVGEKSPGFKLHKRLVDRLSKYSGYYAEVAYRSMEEGNDYLVRGVGLYMKGPRIIPIEQVAEVGENFDSEEVFDIETYEPNIKSITEKMIEETKLFIKTIHDFSFKENENLQPLMSPLKDVFIRQGYVLDGFMCGDDRNGAMDLYIRKKDAAIQYVPDVREKKPKAGFLDVFGTYGSPTEHTVNPYSDEMFIKGPIPYIAAKTIPSIYEYIELPFLPLPIWGAYLLTLASFYLPKNWHGCYGMGDIILDKETLIDACKDAVDYNQYLEDERITPRVTLTSDTKATLSFCYWNSWRGLSYVTVDVDKCGEGVRFVERKSEVLLEYDCGLRF